MQDFSISRCTRKCAVSGRGLEPGERYVSVILPEGESVRRIDISAAQWNGPQPETIGWWRSRMPDADARKMRPAPVGVLLDTLSELLERPGKEALAYLLAVLLVRRRVLSEEQTLELDLADEPNTHWNLVCPADGRQWNILITVPRTDALEQLQEELDRLLFTEE